MWGNGDSGVGQINSSNSCRAAVTVVAVLIFAGCRSAELQQRREAVSDDISDRFGADLVATSEPGATFIPPGVATEDGLTEDEAVAIALWNNAAYQSLLADLGVSSAQLLDAGLISDPQFTIFFPLGPKQLEFTAFQAVDALWLQPVRVRAAELDLDRVSQTMVQNGLDVIRDVRVAHANLLLAQQQAEVASEAESLRRKIAELAQKRLDAGDISELEATTSRIDALQARATASRAVPDVELARQRLLALLGLVSPEARVQSPEMTAVASPSLPLDSGPSALDSLLSTALAMRPDLRAAEVTVEAACERVGLARKQFMNLDAVYDANGSGSRGFESGPGLRFSIPIFNRNQGGIAIADAQWQRAARQYVAVRDQVTLEVRTAHTQMEQAQQNLNLVRNEILPALQQAQELARRNYENGGAPYFLVLQTTSQYLDARSRELQLEADLRRAIAELERGVGMKVQRRESSVQIGVSPESTGVSPELRVQRSGTTISCLQLRSHRFERSDGARRDHRIARSKVNERRTQQTNRCLWTLDSRLWTRPRLVPSGVRAAESGSVSEDGTGKD
jgi:cobalt-zinc-cadmium efflux system outer membrane protein